MNRAAEHLRQAQEAFDQNKSQAQRWFDLRIRTGYAVVALGILLAAISAFLIVCHAAFPAWMIGGAAFAMPSGIAGVTFAAWKLILSPGSAVEIKPVLQETAKSTRRTSVLPRKSGE